MAELVAPPSAPRRLQQLRALLERLEHPDSQYDQPTAAALRHLVLCRISELEAAQSQDASAAPVKAGA